MADIPQDDHRPLTEHVRSRSGILKNPASQSDESIRPPACVRFVLANGQKLDAAARPYIVLGREEEDNTQQIDIDFGSVGGREDGISRSHAIMHVTSNAVLIKDFNSRNGTFLNGFELHPMKNYALHDGDELILGRVKMRVQFIY